MTDTREPAAAQGGEAEVIRPPGMLRAKVRTEPVRDADALFAAVDRQIAGNAESFLAHAVAELGAMRSALHHAVTSAEKRAESLDRVFTIAHDLKGQGSSFGFPLITRVAALLCQYLRTRRPNDGQGLRIAAAHVEALNILVEHRVGGEGGRLGSTMIERLERLVLSPQG